MGLFDSLIVDAEKPQVVNTLTNIEAFFGILIIATLADGDISDKERERFNFFVGSNKFILRAALTSGIPGGEYSSQLLQKTTKICSEIGKDLFIELCASSLPQDWRKPVFTMLADLMFMDGSPCKENISLLNKTYKHLDVSDEEALAIVNIIKQLHYFDL